MMKTVAELNLPADRRYTAEHVWIMPDGDFCLVGISDFAQDQLGEVAYVDLPSKGNSLNAHAEFGSIESVKAVNALFMPVDGDVLEVNNHLEDSPQTVNADCYGAGWLARIRPVNAADVDKLMDAEAYRTSLDKA